jgi:hypothetical protein
METQTGSGFPGVHRGVDLHVGSAIRCDRPKQPTKSLRASVSSDRSRLISANDCLIHPPSAFTISVLTDHDDSVTELRSRCRAVRVLHATPEHELKRAATRRYGVVRRVDDLQSALVLSSAMAIAAAAAVPLLLPSLPAGARSLPFPQPVFCTVLAVQLVVVYGLLGFVGLRLARTRGFEPAPCLNAIWDPKSNR